MLSTEDVKKIAHLARLHFSEEDIETYLNHLSNILNFIAQMNQRNTDEIEPLAHPLQIAQRLREDRITETNERQKFQAIAPLCEAGLYLVPRVLDES